MVLIEKNTNLIKHQGMQYELGAENVVVKDENNNIQFYFGDLNENNSYIEDLPFIEAFIGNKYMFIDGEVVLNLEYDEPTEE